MNSSVAPRFAAVILAAGGSSRLGVAKQLLRDERGATLVHRTTSNALACGAHPVVVVVGAEADSVREAVRDLPVQTVENDLWQEGLSSSIRCGVQVVSLLDRPPDALLLMACDMPSVSVEHLQALWQLFDAGAVRVASSYDQTVGIPAIIARAEWTALLELSGDRGAKSILMCDKTHRVPLRDGGFDLDTPEDVARWRSSQPPR